tara:strand:+ start:13421 stop:13879 length:459 start_codon:yes stop_codon:yes gene_type:complete
MRRKGQGGYGWFTDRSRDQSIVNRAGGAPADGPALRRIIHRAVGQQGQGVAPQPSGDITAATAILDGEESGEDISVIPLFVAKDTLPLDPFTSGTPSVDLPGVPAFENMYATKVAVVFQADNAVAGPWVLKLWVRTPEGTMNEVATFEVVTS